MFLRPGLLAQKVSRKFREEGFAATLTDVLRRLRADTGLDEFDRIHGTDTGGEVPLWRPRIDSPNARFGVKYQASNPDELADSIRHLRIDPPEFTFIDLGCGKGRALIGAAKLKFQKIIRVEFSGELVSIANANVHKLGLANVEVAHTDAAEYVFPSFANMVVYFYNPFSLEIMAKVERSLGKPFLSTFV